MDSRVTRVGVIFHPVFEGLEAWPAQYAVVARLTSAFRRLCRVCATKLSTEIGRWTTSSIVLMVGRKPVVSSIMSERSSPSRVRFAALNNGAPLTAPGRSGQHS